MGSEGWRGKVGTRQAGSAPRLQKEPSRLLTPATAGPLVLALLLLLLLLGTAMVRHTSSSTTTTRGPPLVPLLSKMRLGAYDL